MMPPIVVPVRVPVNRFDAGLAPIARVRPDEEVIVETTDAAYRTLSGEQIDSGGVRFESVNALTGPMLIEGAEPGDAIGFTVSAIDVGTVAYVPYVARWRRRAFGERVSSVTRGEVSDDGVELPNGGRIVLRPVIGCIGVAPTFGGLSSLAPCSPTGGNMDLVELGPGTTIWLPCQVSGGLLSLGDLHARMGRGEPVGAGLECAGRVHGIVRLANGAAPTGPILVRDDWIGFVGSHADDRFEAERIAVAAAWQWLRGDAELDTQLALAICAGLLDVGVGGPAGANIVAGFDLSALRAAGVNVDRWPVQTALRTPSA